MARRKYPSPRKPGALLLTLVLLALALTGATLAYLITHTDPVPNRSLPPMCPAPSRRTLTARPRRTSTSPTPGH
ncbi:MAG: hypothetical protein ACLUIX_01690 [Oscillospiraceae bacterium]